MKHRRRVVQRITPHHKKQGKQNRNKLGPAQKGDKKRRVVKNSKIREWTGRNSYNYLSGPKKQEFFNKINLQYHREMQTATQSKQICTATHNHTHELCINRRGVITQEHHKSITFNQLVKQILYPMDQEVSKFLKFNPITQKEINTEERSQELLPWYEMQENVMQD